MLNSAVDVGPKVTDGEMMMLMVTVPEKPLRLVR